MEITLTDVVSGLESGLRRFDEKCEGPAKVRILMTLFNLSLRDVVDGAGRAISKSQLHRILRGQSATAFERKAIAVGITECLKSRCDSAYLFSEGTQK